MRFLPHFQTDAGGDYIYVHRRGQKAPERGLEDKNMKNEMNNDEAVSPVIATILMVAITVVLAGVLYVWASDLANSNQQDSPDLYQYRASNHNDNPGAGTADALMVLEFMQAPADLNWANIDVQITGDDGVPHTCKTDGSTDCTITQYGSDDTFWEKSEVLHLSENGEDLCGGGQCTFDMKISDTRSGTTLTGTTTVIVE
jgi:flagellin-like protein